MSVGEMDRAMLGVAGSLIVLLLSIIAYFASKSLDELGFLGTSLQGHLLQHAATDVKAGQMFDKVEQLNHNTRLLCKYGEPTWPGHDACKYD